MKKELLNEVERKYFEVKEDGRVEFFSKNAKEFLMAFTKEFLYEYCKDVVFGNPIILFTDIKKNNNYLKYLNIDESGNPNKDLGFYRRNGIIINVLYRLQTRYNQFSKQYSENNLDMTSLLELSLIEVLIHELVHSVEYINDEYVELRNSMIQTVHIFIKYENLINEYLSCDKYKFDCIELLSILRNFDSTEELKNVSLSVRNKVGRYKTKSIINHLLTEVLYLESSAAKEVTELVFKQNYTLHVSSPLHQDNIYQSDILLNVKFDKEILTSYDLYMSKVAKIREMYNEHEGYLKNVLSARSFNRFCFEEYRNSKSIIILLPIINSDDTHYILEYR